MTRWRDKGEQCAYCGVKLERSQREHVIPKALYAGVDRQCTTIPRITVPTCTTCNGSWMADERDFRDVLAVAGMSPNVPRQGMWQKVKRSWHKEDGAQRILTLRNYLHPITDSSGARHKVYPAQVPPVGRVVAKVVRGLCYGHSLASPVPQANVRVGLLVDNPPAEIFERMRYEAYIPPICEYWFAANPVPALHSLWIVHFLESVAFIGFVSCEPWAGEWNPPAGIIACAM